jgi:uncharacterized protein
MVLGQVSVVGNLSEVKKEYVFKGRVSGTYVHACDRCLDGAEFPFAIDVLWVFSQQAGGAPAASGAKVEDDQQEDTAANVFFVGKEVDLAPRVWEEIVLGAPSKFLCSEDCAGLCQYCGANLNHDSCTCGDQELDSDPDTKGLAGLTKLFPDTKPNRVEE